MKQDSSSRAEIPPEVLPILFSAQQAADELGAPLEIIDANRLSITERVREKLTGRPIPRVSVGEIFLSGPITKAEIVELFNRACSMQVQK